MGLNLRNFLIDRGIRKVDRPNHYYYGKLKETLDKIEQPTVMDAILAMRKQGNAVYSRAYGTTKQSPLKKTEPTPEDPTGEQWHEICHLAAQFQHTVPGEVALLAFERGLKAGAGIRDPEEIAGLRDDLKNQNWRYSTYHGYADQWGEPYKEASDMNVAVNMAAGMYLREKIDAFKQAGLLGLPKEHYMKQKKFCDTYADTDHIIEPGAKAGWDDIGAAPYALIQFSKPEWNAIRAVATGICEPSQTKYPKRLEAVKEALVATGYFYDVKPSMERAKGEGFDLEKFNAARAKRGAEQREWTR